MDDLALGPPIDLDIDDPFDPSDPVSDAVELKNAGYFEEAFDLLNALLHRDLRCIDAHAHLGSFTFDLDPEQALHHFQVGVGIGERSLPPGFDGVLLWGHVGNRPFLRCLHGAGLCQWRLGRFAEAAQTFLRILSFNPNDNQGVRFVPSEVEAGRAWSDRAA